MFTGIIAAVGQILSLQPRSGDFRIGVDATSLDMSDVQLGDSIATNGVCLTVVSQSGQSFWADVSRETLDHSTLGSLSAGTLVNLEKALTPTTRMGGHMVSGHVDGVGQIRARHEDGRSVRLTIAAPDGLAKYIAAKGSICIDGVSLTVNGVNGADFELNIVPHTAQETIIQRYAIGVAVNIEVDLIARYLERLLLGDRPAANGTASSGPEKASDAISLAFLAQHGFVDKLK